MSELNAMVEEINTFLALRGYPPFSVINQFTSEQWFDFSQIAMCQHRNIALFHIFKQFGIERSPKTHIVR
ncbi:hypothetical protein [Acinetobacter baumannii]|uniref:hypothetical protein n=1 Tax=Acinetobacter baumannii TaxID=470 RepID=UPI001CB7F219|nr:hypothetical protein [Acinetobacter baumannii]MBZ0435315.1 hypothetical protein [Acinetobacter baumannii]